MIKLSEGQNLKFSISLKKDEENLLKLNFNKFYLYTNTLNLSSFLSRGMIYPLHKEDSDFIDISTTNGKGLMLFKNSVSYDTCRESWKDVLNVPVAISVNLNEYADKLYIIDNQYVCREGKLSQLAEDDIGVFIPGCMPFSLVEGIFLNNDNDVSSFISKKDLFGEVPFGLIPIKKTIDSFGDKNYDILTLKALIESINIQEKLYDSNKINLVSKYIGLIIAAYDYITSAKPSYLFLDLIKILTLFPSLDIKDFKKRYNKLSTEGLDYENFKFINSFYLLSVLVASQYSNKSINEDFKTFVSDYFSSKKPDADDLVRYFLNFAITRLFISTKGEPGELKGEFFEKLEKEFSAFVKGTKKATKKITEKYFQAFNNIKEIYEYKLDLESIVNWERELSQLKLLLLISFNDDFERSYDLRKDKAKYALNDQDLLNLVLCAAFFNGINHLNAKYKNEKILLSGIISALLPLFNCGLNYNSSEFLPILTHKKNDERTTQHAVDGLGKLMINFTISEAIEDTAESLIRTLTEMNSEDLVKVVEALELYEVINTEIIFESITGGVSIVEEIKDDKIKITVNSKPKLINYKVNLDPIKEKLERKENTSITYDRIKQIIEKLKIGQKK